MHKESIVSVLHISHLFPSVLEPFMGTFMAELQEGLEKYCDTQFLVPTPISFPFSNRSNISRSGIDGRYRAEKVFYLSVPRRKLPHITRHYLYKSIARFLKKNNKFDLIHVHWAFPESLLYPMISNFDVPIVHSFHGQAFYETLNNRDTLPFLRKAIRGSDRIIAVGKKLNRDIIDAFPIAENKCIFIPNGIDQSKFTIGNKIEARQKLNWDTDSIHILCVAHLTFEKGIDVLLRSFQLLKTKKKNAVLHLVGRTYNYELLEMIKQYRNDIKNIQYHGPVPHSELPNYYNAADLNVLPSRVEGFGVALVEAGMSGLPLISTKCGGPEDIIDESTGVLVSPDDPQQLYEALAMVIDNLNTFKSHQIRERMIDKFSKDRIASRTFELYSSVIKKYKNS